MVKIIYYILDSTDYSTLTKAHTPNIDSLDPHPALSWSRMSRGSVALFLGGFLPTCERYKCHHNSMTNQIRTFFLDKLGMPLFIGCPCGWVLDLIKPFMTAEDIALNMVLHDEHPRTTQKLLHHFNERYRPLDDYFAYIHVQETHFPFWCPEINKGDNVDTKRIKAIEYADELLEPLLEIETDFLVVSSDHNHKWGHKWDKKDFDVFLATRGEWPADHWRKVLEAGEMKECG